MVKPPDFHSGERRFDSGHRYQMLTVKELESILEIKDWSAGYKKVLHSMALSPRDTAETMLPYLNVDFLVNIIQREIGFTITKNKIEELKHGKSVE